MLAVDDEAQAYVARHYAVPAGSAQAAKPSTRVVYAAIDGQPASYGYDSAANVSGVLERLPLAAIRETLLTLRNGQPARLAVIGPTDPTGFAEIQQVQAFDWGPHRLAAATGASRLRRLAAGNPAARQLGRRADRAVLRRLARGRWVAQAIRP